MLIKIRGNPLFILVMILIVSYIIRLSLMFISSNSDGLFYLGIILPTITTYSIYKLYKLKPNEKPKNN